MSPAEECYATQQQLLALGFSLRVKRLGIAHQFRLYARPDDRGPWAIAESNNLADGFQRLGQEARHRWPYRFAPGHCEVTQ